MNFGKVSSEDGKIDSFIVMPGLDCDYAGILGSEMLLKVSGIFMF